MYRQLWRLLDMGSGSVRFESVFDSVLANGLWLCDFLYDVC